MLNAGYIEATVDGVIARIYYDAAAAPVGDSQPLIDGPRGYCLDLTNTTGRTRRVEATLPGGAVVNVNIGQGDPVTSGPPAGRSRTLTQMRNLGFNVRGDVAGFMIG